MNFNNPFVVAIDFDGTITEETNSNIIGTIKENAKETIKWMKDNGCFLILWTCRTGTGLDDAINFLKRKEIKFDTINKNAPFLDFPTSSKIFANAYIDNRNLNCPGIDWLKIKEMIQQKLVEKAIESLLQK